MSRNNFDPLKKKNVSENFRWSMDLSPFETKKHCQRRNGLGTPAVNKSGSWYKLSTSKSATTRKEKSEEDYLAGLKKDPALKDVKITGSD